MYSCNLKGNQFCCFLLVILYFCEHPSVISLLKKARNWQKWTSKSKCSFKRTEFLLFLPIFKHCERANSLQYLSSAMTRSKYLDKFGSDQQSDLSSVKTLKSFFKISCLIIVCYSVSLSVQKGISLWIRFAV